MANEIRFPKQKRAIEKRNEIIKKGFYLMCNNGYHKTNTIMIAKEANVSTGSVYNYFKSKKDIFLAGIRKYGDEIINPIYNYIDISSNLELENVVDKIISLSIQNHTLSKKAHNEMIAMYFLDSDVANEINKLESDVINKIIDLARVYKISENNLKEKITIIFGIIENYSHDFIYNKKDDIDYSVKLKIITTTVLNILKK